MRSDREWLLDILEAAENIDDYTSKGRSAFEDDKLIQVWIIHHIQIIGEAAARLSESIRSKYPDIPWSDIVSMRNVVVHHYFGVDLNQIWDAAQNDVPALKTWILRVIREEEL